MEWPESLARESSRYAFGTLLVTLGLFAVQQLDRTGGAQTVCAQSEELFHILHGGDAAGKQVKEEGLPNDMVDRIAADPAFGLTKEEIVAGLVPENFVGRAPQQVEEFIANVLQPIFDANPDAVEQHASLSV